MSLNSPCDYEYSNIEDYQYKQVDILLQKYSRLTALYLKETDDEDQVLDLVTYFKSK